MAVRILLNPQIVPHGLILLAGSAAQGFSLGNFSGGQRRPFLAPVVSLLQGTDFLVNSGVDELTEGTLTGQRFIRTMNLTSECGHLHQCWWPHWPYEPMKVSRWPSII